MVRGRASLLIGAAAIVAAGAWWMSLGGPIARIILAAGAACALASLHVDRNAWPLVVFLGLGVAGVLAGGREVDGYVLRAGTAQGPEPYPWSGVVSVIIVQCLAVSALAFILRPRSYGPSWGRAVVAGLSFLCLALYIGVRLMHGPPYALMHWLWAVAGVGGCLLLVLLALVAPRPRHA